MKDGLKRVGKLGITVTPKNKLDIAANTIKEIAEESTNHFVQGFRQGGGQTDKSRSGWKPRKSGSDGRAILVKSGALWRDLEVRNITKNSVTIGTNRIPYAATHNEGLEIPDIVPKRRKALKFTIGGKTYFRKRVKGFKMPQREFLGHSSDLNDKNIQIISTFVKKVLLAK